MKWSIASKTMEEGRELVNQDRVIKLVPDETETVWRAEIIDDQTYKVILDGTAKEEDYCSCDAFAKKGYCKHTVAAELFLRELGMTRVFKFNDELRRYPEVEDSEPLVDTLVEEFDQEFQVSNNQMNQRPSLTQLAITIEIYNEAVSAFQIDYHDLFYLRLKIGHQRQYYVTDLEQFFHIFNERGLYTLPNREREQVLLSPYCFDKTAYDFLNHLARNYQFTNLLASKMLHAPESKNLKQRYFLSADEFTALIAPDTAKALDIKLIIDQEELHPHLSQEKAQVLAINDQGENWQLNFNPKIKIFQNYGIAASDQGIIGLNLSAKEYSALDLVHQQIAENDFTLDLDQEDAHAFLALFGYLLTKLGTINGIAEDKISALADQQIVELVFNAQANALEIAVVFHYGDYQIGKRLGETKLPDQAILFRDYLQEITVENTLISLGFSPQGDIYQSEFASISQAMAYLKRLLHMMPADWAYSYTDKLADLDAENINPRLQVNSDSGNRYLSIDFTIDDVESEEVDRILAAIVNAEDYYQMDDGRVLDVQNILEDQETDMLKHLNQQNETWHNGDVVPIYQTLPYASALKGQELFQQFYDEVIHSKDHMSVDLNGLKTDLADYQLQAVKWMQALGKYQLGGLLADEMGLGKTVQTIAFILSSWNNDKAIQGLVLAPASVLYNWAYEFRKFAPDIKVLVIDGSAQEREDLRQTDHTVAITSYQSYRNDKDAYQETIYDILVLDEAQAIKNERTMLYQSVAKQGALMRLALSGTPLENNLNEFWALMQIVLPGLLPEAKSYQQMATEEIRRVVSPFVYRRTKEEVALDLPNKEVTDRYTKLEREQKNIYLAYLEDIKHKLQAHDKQANMHMDLLAGITRLRQICCHPKLINADYQGESGKFEYFKESLDRALDADKSVLVFSQFTSMLKLMEDHLQAMGISYYSITGKTKKQDRQAQVQAFNQGERKVFLISLRAGGVGLNLTGADTVFLYDLWWNPAVEEQAIGRAHRIGQTHDVEVYRFITEGTIEQRIAELQEEKRVLFDELFAEDGSAKQSLSLEDLQFILGIN
ncbi:SNF2-related protein [Aerococcus kribbianus]|uniref:SNF2-related protein n=1 Tax=Aerococcus kribbianus TaxID=2999064 RepID=A0A9X3FNF8_9LACT|nr:MULTISPECIES: SNF2-related protein [unclassified Aerococcus]MCZ0716758.1 SNF2-related protein [Aerococcus sp. YH-aer221]MCZ0725046.1 SNF2-related protein [Aerococcus sp. YH-aer222]